MFSCALITDADNTLWDTDKVFAESQLSLLAFVEARTGTYYQGTDRLAFVRKFDQAIAETHHLHLRYPSHILVRALTKALRGEIPKYRNLSALEPTSWEKESVELYELNLKSLPPLRPGVRETFPKLAAFGIPVIVATEGSSERCQSRIRHWHLEGMVTTVVSAPKTTALYLRLSKLAKAEPSHCFVIGDQLDRDILPAKSAGLRTVYFPGGFAPKWAPKENEVQPDFVISSFSELLSVLNVAHRIF